MQKSAGLTPRQIVERLDQYIVGQKDAKKAVAVALRNRFRRSLLDEKLRDEISPKNILMMGPTGVGKTEIARRIAKIVAAPFVKVEATKFTEVGYVGRDVESMVRDLVETSVRLVKEEKVLHVKERAEIAANNRLVDLLVPSNTKKSANYKNPLEMLFGGGNTETEPEETSAEELSKNEKKKIIKEKLALGELEEEVITVEVEEQQPSMFDMLQGSGMEQMGMNMQDALGSFMPKKKKKRKLTVREARTVLINEEAQKLIDMDEVTQEAVVRAEQMGIIFIDEIDKIASKSNGGSSSADVSREGVQRDILPVVEGSTVVTKYGSVKTDHVLFIAAGAFHMSKPSDLIPELQGRFPIRVELTKLTVDDFYRILVEPDNALVKQYRALLQTEGIEIEFSDDAIRKIAEVAYDVNQNTDNIGARRLHTILEKLLEDLSFEAPEITMEKITITPQYVEEKLGAISRNKDLSQFIL
ncbi:HslU--HslV peptidase ATPase subunit [Bacillus sp. B1-b2]|uniref:HslU--HslV peptidase ATPase subunit n=1 Tax=Bacillus sp. B1-b2 TaxID=2653201 RepID=UPI001261479C|nr:HslU--HslV peptidase ATPase subunit [Bacillus sp. B1-b2]KAB7668631.1 HslU--HslV peptidase ATPase subunit [Bacillus sp. B1-b2]